jgi:hypothetical protein
MNASVSALPTLRDYPSARGRNDLNDLVALMPVTFRESTAKRDFNTHRLLRTVARNTVVSMLPAEELAAPDERFRT